MIAAEAEAATRRAKELYASGLRAQLEPAHAGEYVCIEPESGDYFLGPTLPAAVDAARRAHPGRWTHTIRIGHPVVFDVGGCS
jgi:hypothetical protein